MSLSWSEIRNRVDGWWAKSNRGKSTDRLWIAAWVAFVLVASVVFSTKYWDWLSIEESNGTEIRTSGSEIIRNLGLFIAALIALPLAIWRSIVAERQAAASQHQAETAQSGLLNERYQKGAEMLGSQVLSVRIGGIYDLMRLAHELPEKYHTQVMQFLCAFIRTSSEGIETNEATDGEKSTTPLPRDVRTVLAAISKRSEAQMMIEEEESYILDLSDARLIGANLTDAVLLRANLAGANMAKARASGAKLSGAVLDGANLIGASLKDVDLSRARLVEARLSNASLQSTNLTGADLEGADSVICKIVPNESD